jgi:methylmalonyl-CoA mutase
VRRVAAPFEKLRAAAEGVPAKVFLACIGDLASHGARATWITNFLAAGGIAAEQSSPLATADEAAAAFKASGAHIACICGADATYGGDLGTAVAGALKSAGAQRVYLAGRPKDQEAALRAAGVDAFIFAGADALATLSELHKALGIAES